MESCIPAISGGGGGGGGTLLAHLYQYGATVITILFPSTQSFPAQLSRFKESWNISVDIDWHASCGKKNSASRANIPPLREGRGQGSPLWASGWSFVPHTGKGSFALVQLACWPLWRLHYFQQTVNGGKILTALYPSALPPPPKGPSWKYPHSSCFIHLHRTLLGSTLLWV